MYCLHLEYFLKHDVYYDIDDLYLLINFLFKINYVITH